MNSNNNPIKTVLLEATSENKYNFKVHLCPEYIDIKCGSWSVAVKDITCVSTRDINKFVNITTNLVDGKKLDKYNHFNPQFKGLKLEKKDQNLPNLI